MLKNDKYLPDFRGDQAKICYARLIGNTYYFILVLRFIIVQRTKTCKLILFSLLFERRIVMVPPMMVFSICTLQVCKETVILFRMTVYKINYMYNLIQCKKSFHIKFINQPLG